MCGTSRAGRCEKVRPGFALHREPDGRITDMAIDTAGLPEPQSMEAERLDAATLAARYSDRVHRFAAIVCRSDADAADLAQEALVSAVRRLDSYRPERGTIDSWLWRIVVNTARDAGRATRRRARLWQRLFSAAVVAPQASPEDIALGNIADADLLAAVRRLPKRDRTIVALRFGAQLTTADLARELKTTPAGVVMATRRALHRLRRELEGRA